LSDEQTQAPEKPPKAPPAPAPAKDPTVCFQHNRAFELWINGSIHSTWSAYESKTLPREIIDHPDFQAKKQAGFFTVQEVN
jgi:hypothetical protein